MTCHAWMRSFNKNVYFTTQSWIFLHSSPRGIIIIYRLGTRGIRRNICWSGVILILARWKYYRVLYKCFIIPNKKYFDQVKESSGSAIFNLTIFHRSAKLECACLAWLPRVVTTNDIHESAKIGGGEVLKNTLGKTHFLFSNCFFSLNIYNGNTVH